MNEVDSIVNWIDVDYGQVGVAESIDPWMLAWLWFAMDWISILIYLATAIWLFLINKKLWEKYPWVSFLPIINVYSYFSASKKSWLHYLILPIIAVAVWTILFIPTFGISFVIATIYAMIMWIRLLHAISIRTGRWVWTTIWFIFIPFIMYPVVGYKMEENKHWDNNEPNQKNTEL